jgi:hypothetical protein
MGPRGTWPGPEQVTGELITSQPDYRLEALRLAVDFTAGRDIGGVLHAAREFRDWLTARPARITLSGPVITSRDDPARAVPLKRSGANMAVTMSDTDQAAYTVSETDSRGFPVSGDAITWTENSNGAVVTTDGTSGVFVAVAPGTVQVTATDGTLSASDTINVVAGSAAALVLGSAAVTPAGTAATSPPAAPAAPSAAPSGTSN